MIPFPFQAGQLGRRRVGGGPNYTLGTTNLFAGLSTGTMTLLGPFSGSTISRINDGNALSSANIVGTSFINSLDATAARNNGIGVEVNFPVARRIGRFQVSCYGTVNGAVFNWAIEYFNGTTWVSAATPQANGSAGFATYTDINVPSALGVVAQRWRIYISSWAGTNNFYAGEVRAYEWV